MTQYVVTTRIHRTVTADSQAEAEDMATEYFDMLNFTGHDVDIEGEYDVEEY